MQPDIIITKQKFIRVADGSEIIGIVPDKNLGYYKSMLHLKEQGHDVNKYGCLETMKLNVPRLFKPVMAHLEDFKVGDKVEIWTHQGFNPYETRTIKAIDFETKEVVIAPDVWNEYEDELFDEFHFLAGLKHNKDVDVSEYI